MAVVEAASRYRWVILGLCILSQISGAMIGQSLGPLSPLFQKDLGLSKTEVGLFVAAIHSGGLCALLLTGSLGDRYGIRRVMSLGQVLAGALLLSVALAQSGVQAAAVMFAAGAARSPVITLSAKSILEWFPPRIRATAMGLKQTGGSMAGIGAAVLMPALGLALGWRQAMALLGVAVVAAGLVTAVLYRNPQVSSRARGPRVSLRASLGVVLRSRGLWTMGGVALFFGLAQQCMGGYLVLYLHEVVLVSAVPDDRTRIVAAGGYLALVQIGGAGGRVFWGAVSDRLFGGRRLLVLVVTGSVAALSTLAIGQLGADSPLGLLTALTLVLGATMLGWNGVYHAQVVEVTGIRYAATGLGLCLSLLEVGMTVGPPIFGLIVDLSGSYGPAWVYVSGACVGGALLSIVAARETRKAIAGQEA